MIKKNDGISKDDICQNQFTAYVVLAVKRKRQSYIKKKQREHEKETRTKKEAEQSEFRTAGYDMWSRMEPQNEKLMAAIPNTVPVCWDRSETISSTAGISRGCIQPDVP